jgi:hypothetical protein
MTSLGRLSKTAHFGRKSRLALWTSRIKASPISVTEIPESESPFVATKRSAGRSFAEIKRAVASAQGRLSCGERLVAVGCNVVGRWMTIWRQPHRSPIRRQIVIDRWRTGACYRPIWDPFQPVKSMSNGLELSLDPHEILLPSRYGNDLQRLLEVIGIVHTRRSLICCAWRSPRDDVHH